MGEAKSPTKIKSLLDDATSLPDMIAIFLGILELIKIRRILICDNDEFSTILDDEATLVMNENYTEEMAKKIDTTKEEETNEGEA